MAFVIVLGTSVASPAFAEELKGADAIAAINGKTFLCEAGGMKFKINFAKSDPAGRSFPFIYVAQQKTVKNAYIVRKNGRLVSKKGNQSRRIFTNGEAGIVIKATGRPNAVCTSG